MELSLSIEKASAPSAQHGKSKKFAKRNRATEKLKGLIALKDTENNIKPSLKKWAFLYLLHFGAMCDIIN